MELNKLLKPKSIVIVGASEKDGFGGDTTRNLFKFTKNLNRVYLVNPSKDTIFGHKCYHKVEDIEDEIDLAVICTPQKTIISILEQAAEKGCGAAVVFASGYGEAGAEGKCLEKELVEKCNQLGIAVMGPNCAGFANYVDHIFLFAFQMEERERGGSIGMVSQSGQICLSAMDWPCMEFSYVISSGNSLNVKVEDYIEFLVDDPDTKVVTAYIEGISNPETLIRAFERAAEIRKPIIVLKTGRSVKSQELASSHTGSLSGNDGAFRAILKRYGVMEADDLQELYATANLFATLKTYPKAGRFVFMNCSGGEAGVVADLADMFGVALADISKESKQVLQEMLPSYATVNNPLDMTAQLGYDTEGLCIAMRTLFQDDNVDCLSIAYTITEEIYDTTVNYIAEAISIVSKDENRKPIFWLPFIEHTRNRENAAILREAGCPILPSGKYGFKVLQSFNAFMNFEYEKGQSSLPEKVFTAGTIARSEFDSMEFLEKNGIMISPQKIAVTAEEAIAAAKSFGFPTALKISSQDILHKSDIGGVILNLKTDEEVSKAFDTIMHNARTKCPKAKIDGVLIKPMLKTGIEFMVGVNNDPQFGPIVMVGLGGVFVEIFKDVQLSPAPLTEKQAGKMLRKLKGFKLLTGYRGGMKYDVEALEKFVAAISRVAAKNKHVIKELDINPLFVRSDGVEMADALLLEYR